MRPSRRPTCHATRTRGEWSLAALLLALTFPAALLATEIWVKTTPGEVNVAMDGMELGQTFSDGTFKPFELPAGEHVFVFSKDGHVTDTQKIQLKGKQLELVSNLVSEAELRKKEEEERRAKEEERLKRDAELREKAGKDLAAIKVETNVGKGAEVHLGTVFIGFTNEAGVAARENLKPVKGMLIVKAKDYITWQKAVALRKGTVNSFKADMKISEAVRERRAKASGAEQKKFLWLAVGVGGFFLILVAVLILVLTGRRRHATEGYLQPGGSTGTGTDAAPGLFTTPQGGVPQEDLNQLLENSNNLEVLIGKRILGDYLIEKKIGEGGMGAILLAKQESLDRYTALKIILPKFSANENVVKRFFREVRLTSKLEHPNIVTIYNFGKSREGILFVAMEFLDGAPLDGLLRKDGPMRPERAVPIAAQIASALSEAHEKGVVHRDLKPSNIMLIKRGGMVDYAKVLDFGIAKSIEETDDDEPQLTMTGQILGTPAYMSPEQCSGKKLGPATDTYSLGIIAFELLTGKKPYMAESAIGFLQQHLMTPPPKLSAFIKDGSVPPEADMVFARVLAKKVEDRYPSALDFARELGLAYKVKLNVPGLHS